MITIGIRYLCGYAVATDVGSRQHAEWPPHPGRVFMALAAAHFETGADPRERTALEWLENVETPPVMRFADTEPRTIVTNYVPVNDVEISDQLRKKCAKAEAQPGDADVAQAVALLPERRPKQRRTFPRVWLRDDVVLLTWDATPSPDDREALETLCQKVTRIGHSSSLVQVWVAGDTGAIQPTVVPTEGVADMRLRGTSPGLLSDLAARFRQTEMDEFDRLTAQATAAPTKKRQRERLRMRDQQFLTGRPTPQRPVLGVWHGYKRIRKTLWPAAVTGPFSSDIVVLRRAEGHVLGLASSLQLTGALRDAAMKSSPQPVPEWLSGHTADGGPSQRPHIAFFPLPFVGHEHADGHLMGVAIAVPRGIESSELQQYLGPLFFDVQTGEPRTIRLWKNGRAGRVWEWRLEREDRESPPSTLCPETWTGPSRVWASVTPVVLHHYPKRNRPEDTERILRDACQTAHLPAPDRIATSPIAFHRATGHVRQMPFLEITPERLCRFQVHCMIEFPQEIEGPVLVGRGRYRGYGLLMPIRRGGER